MDRERERAYQSLKKTRFIRQIFLLSTAPLECKVDNKAVKVVKFWLAIIYQPLSPRWVQQVVALAARQAPGGGGGGGGQGRHQQGGAGPGLILQKAAAGLPRKT